LAGGEEKLIRGEEKTFLLGGIKKGRPSATISRRGKKKRSCYLEGKDTKTTLSDPLVFFLQEKARTEPEAERKLIVES